MNTQHNAQSTLEMLDPRTFTVDWMRGDTDCGRTGAFKLFLENSGEQDGGELGVAVDLPRLVVIFAHTGQNLVGSKAAHEVGAATHEPYACVWCSIDGRQQSPHECRWSENIRSPLQFEPIDRSGWP